MRIPRWAIATSVILIGGGGYWYYTSKTSTQTKSGTQVVLVSRGNISSTVKTTGKISPIQTSVLSFTKQGTVSKILKKVGENVTAGDVIAEIDASDAYMDIESAKISLNNAENSYNKLFQSATEADKIKAKNSLEESKNSLKLLEAEYVDYLTSQKNTLLEKEASLEILEDKLALAESDLEYTQKNLDTTNDVSDLERDIANAYLSVEEAARFFPSTFRDLEGLTYYDNKTSERYGDLGSKNSYQKAGMEKLLQSVSGSLSGFEKNLSTIRTKEKRTLDDVLSLLTTAKTLMSDMNTLSAMAVDTYSSTPTGIPFSQGDIDSAKEELRTLGNTITSKLSSLNSTYTTLKNYGSDEIETLSNKNTISTKEQAVKSAKNALAQARREYEAEKISQNTDTISRQNEIIRAKNTITANELSYKEMIDGPTPTDRKSAENSISNANISLKKAYLGLKDYQIVAPFDGVINDIPWKIGDTTTSTEGVLIENKDAYEIALSLDQIDIVKVNEGQNAKITLDAFPNESYTGKVSRVSAVPTETSGVVSYEAIVELTINREDIYSKMSATVEILTTEKNNVLTLPTIAIFTEGGKSYVNRALDREIYARIMASSRSGSIISGGTGNKSGSFRRGDFQSGSERPSRTISGERVFGSGMNMSGALRNTNSGNLRTNSRRNTTISQTLTTTENIASEKIEITVGISSDGKTEVLSGLEVGDVLVISGKSATSTTRSSTSNSSQNTTRTPGVGGFGGGRPPF